MLKRVCAMALAAALCLSMGVCVEAANQDVIQIEAGLGFSLFLTADGTLYGCGRNEHGQLGPDATTVYESSCGYVVKQPEHIADGVREVAASTGIYSPNNLLIQEGGHTLVLMENGDLYAMGNNYLGQLGQGDREEYTGLQFVMDHVKTIAAGDTASAAITEDGDLYWWGMMMDQMYSHGPYAMVTEPKKVLDDVAALDMGGGHLIALKTDGTVWTMGSASYGARGDGESGGINAEMGQVFEGAVAVSAGEAHNLVLTAAGEVYGWGSNCACQLGYHYNSYDQFTEPVYVMDDVKVIEAGYDNSYVIKNNGDLWAFGTSYSGQLGIGYQDYDGMPIKTASDVKAVSSGKYFAMLMKEDGSTYATGNNFDYQFGSGTQMYNVLAWEPCGFTASPIREKGEMPFNDVTSMDYFFHPVQWAVDNAITTGTTATTFSPDALCNRAQILTFLWRAAGAETPVVVNQYRDVDRNGYYFNALRWAQEAPFGNSMLNVADTGNLFRPNDPCTRAEAVEFMWKYAGSPACDSSALPFTDVKPGASYAQAVAWALEQGVTTGTSDTAFSPNATCTRGQIATFLYRAFAE